MAARKKTPFVDEIAPEPAISEEETFTFKAKHVYAVLVVFAMFIGLLLGYVLWGRTPAAPRILQVPVTQPAGQQPSTPQPVATPTLEHITYNIPTDGFPTLGPADAPVTIVEFSDYQCPFCTQFQEQTLPQLLSAYPDKIKLVYRNFPLTQIHQNAMMAAEAALCAGDQNAYWKYHDKLFSENAQLNNQQGTVLPIDTYVQWATDIGIDGAAFQTCLSSGKTQQAVQADLNFAASLPTENGEAAVGGTPTFFINGERVVGALPFVAFQQIIDAQLAAVKP